MPPEELQTPTPEVPAAEVVSEQVVEDTPEAAPEPSAADAAFEQGFNAVDGKDDPAPEPTPEPEPPKFAGKTEAEIVAALEKLNELESSMQARESKIFGTIGNLKQQQQELAQAIRASQQSGVKLSKEHFKRLSDEYPDVAEALLEGLGSVPLASQAADPQEIARVADQIVQQRLVQNSQTYEQKLLSVKHPDWMVVRGEPEFLGWVETLPAQEKQYLATTWDSAFVSQKLSEFKDWKSKTVQTKESNRSRLEAAITPKGNPAKAAPSLEDEFLKGFNSLGPVR